MGMMAVRLTCRQSAMEAAESAPYGPWEG